MNPSGNTWTEHVLPHVPGFIRRNFTRLLFSFVFALLLTFNVHNRV